VINVLTVHWRSDRWIEPQLDYLERHIDAPYRVFAALNGIEDRALWKRFHYAEDLEGTHPEKLNLLADVVAEDADPSDVLVFLDGDAFPVRPLVPWLHETLSRVPLTAVRRDENLGDVQPHPCFCVTTVGFWRDLGGDWRGSAWINDAGREVNDAGGRLLEALSERHVDWEPLLRSNTDNPHPLWFGVYGHRLYHHGAGFQVVRAERVDWVERYQKDPNVGRMLRPTEASPNLGLLVRRITADPASLRRLRPRHVPALGRATMKTIRLHREHRYYVRRLASDEGRRLEELNQRVFDELLVDPGFYRQFDATEMP
jgi:hypothetical protein